MAGTALNLEVASSGLANLDAGEIITSHRPTEGASLSDSDTLPKTNWDSASDFHLMLIDEDIQRISYLGGNQGILTLTAEAGAETSPTLRLWSNPSGTRSGAMSKANPPRVVQEIKFDSPLECLAVSANGAYVAIVVDGILGLYELSSTGQEKKLVHRGSRTVQSFATGVSEVSFASDSANLRVTSTVGETKLLCLHSSGREVLSDVLESW